MDSLKGFRKQREIIQINERFSGDKIPKAMALIVKYLERRLGSVHQMPGVEHFKNSKGEGYGLRYFTSRGKSFRFNWSNGSNGNSKEIASVDVWDGSSHDPNIEINVKGISLTKILPSLADLIQRPVVGTFPVVAEGARIHGIPLMEARAGADPKEVLEELMDMFFSGATWSENKINQVGRTTAMSLWRKILKLYPNAFSIERSGTKTFISLAKGIKRKSFVDQDILAAMVTIQSDAGPNAEQYTSEEIQRVQGEARKANAIPYEDQLDDLVNLVKAVVAGVSNALFVGGAGGCFSLNTELDIIEDSNEDCNTQKDVVR